MVWGAHLGDPVTCTVVPMKNGHRVHVTYRRTPLNGVQRVAARLLSNRTSEPVKRRMLSEISLEHHQTVFILRHKWNSLTSDHQDSVRRLVREVDVQAAEESRWFRKKPWKLHGNPDVPDLLT